MNRASWVFVFSALGAVLACGPVAPPKQAAGPRVPEEANAGNAPAESSEESSSSEAEAPKGEEAKGMKAKIDARIAPFRWGMTFNQTLAVLDKQLDEAYADKIEKVPAGKAQVSLEQERDKKKAAIRTKKVEFTGGALSGYEVKTPGEFTYRNGEAALEAPRPGAGERVLFFMNDKLWKIYDMVPVAKDGELGDSFDGAVGKLNTEFGEKGAMVEAKKPSASYYGTLITTPARVVWFDGTTQIRLVDNTGRQDSTVKNVALVYEEAATVQKLPTLRSNVEKKTTDDSVDAAAAATGAPVKKDDKKKK
jgi:hypothetical protein